MNGDFGKKADMNKQYDNMNLSVWQEWPTKINLKINVNKYFVCKQNNIIINCKIIIDGNVRYSVD